MTATVRDLADRLSLKRHPRSFRLHPARAAQRQATRAATVLKVAVSMAATLGRPPTDAELAEMFGRSPAAIARLRRIAEPER